VQIKYLIICDDIRSLCKVCLTSC